MPEVSVPLRVSGLNRRWSAGLYQISGFNGKNYYSNGRHVYRPLGMDLQGRAYVHVYSAKENLTHLVAGHPVVADRNGKDLFIQVTALTGPYKDENNAPLWHVSVNNPTDRRIATTLRQNMTLPGFTFAKQQVTLAPGEYAILLHQAEKATPPDPQAKTAD